MNKQEKNAGRKLDAIYEYWNEKELGNLEKVSPELADERYHRIIIPFLKKIKQLVQKNQIIHEREIRKKDLLVKSLKERISKLENEVRSREEKEYQATKANFEILQLLHDLKLKEKKSTQGFGHKAPQHEHKSEVNSFSLNEILNKRIKELETTIVDLKKQRDWLTRSLMEKFNELAS